MKKYILYTNNKTMYHAREIVFDTFEELEKHLREEFYFEKWNFDNIVEDFKTYIEDSLADWVYEYSLKGFLIDVFNVLNGMDIEIFEKIFNGECMILSTYSDNRYSIVISVKDIEEKSDYLIMAINELLKTHGTTTSPIGVVNEYELVVDNDVVEGQLEIEDDIPLF